MFQIKTGPGWSWLLEEMADLNFISIPTSHYHINQLFINIISPPSSSQHHNTNLVRPVEQYSCIYMAPVGNIKDLKNQFNIPAWLDMKDNAILYGRNVLWILIRIYWKFDHRLLRFVTCYVVIRDVLVLVLILVVLIKVVHYSTSERGDSMMMYGTYLN